MRGSTVVPLFPVLIVLTPPDLTLGVTELTEVADTLLVRWSGELGFLL